MGRLALFVMVWLVVHYGVCPIELLAEHKAYQVVRKCHFRQRYFPIGAGIDIVGKSVWTAYYKHQPLAYGLHLLFNIC